MSKFQFEAVVSFDISEAEASSILADQNPNRSVHEWLSRTMPTDKDVHTDLDYGLCHAAEQLKKALGNHLAEKVVSERKMLSAPIPVTEVVNF